MNVPVVQVFESAADVALAAAARLERGVRAADASFRLALSGGSTPVLLFDLLATRGRATGIDWRRVEVYFADERAVPSDHADSNYGQAWRHLLSRVPVPAGNVHRMRAEMEAALAVAEYETLLDRPLDMVLLGMGSDGHIASIFPRTDLVHERTKRVAMIVDSPKPPPRRMTLTPRTLAEARDVVTMVSGEGKAKALARALEVQTDPFDIPARLVRERCWLLDRTAARDVRLDPDREP